MCHAKVDDFTLSKSSPDIGAPTTSESKLQRIIEECAEIEEFDSGIGLLPSTFSGLGDGGLFDDDEIFMDRAQGASTPIAGLQGPLAGNRAPGRVVLRIDNVPWVRHS